VNLNRFFSLVGLLELEPDERAEEVRRSASGSVGEIGVSPTVDAPGVGGESNGEADPSSGGGRGGAVLDRGGFGSGTEGDIGEVGVEEPGRGDA
jgi:hypothetical protein